MDVSLTEVMISEHERISEMLEEVNLAIYEDNSKISEAFNRFKWNMEKHLFIEEKAIFQLLNNISGMEIGDTFRLMEEHGRIIALIKKIEEDFKTRDYSAIQKLMALLEEHSDFENQTFYPTLDKKLEDQKKQEILERVNEILRG